MGYQRLPEEVKVSKDLSQAFQEFRNAVWEVPDKPIDTLRYHIEFRCSSSQYELHVFRKSDKRKLCMGIPLSDVHCKSVRIFDERIPYCDIKNADIHWLDDYDMTTKGLITAYFEDVSHILELIAYPLREKKRVMIQERLNLMNHDSHEHVIHALGSHGLNPGSQQHRQ